MGILSGFDRVLFRGFLRGIMYEGGMMGYLRGVNVLLKDFGEHSQEVTRQLKAACVSVAERENRPVIYLPSPKTSKEYFHAVRSHTTGQRTRRSGPATSCLKSPVMCKDNSRKWFSTQ